MPHPGAVPYEPLALSPTAATAGTMLSMGRRGITAHLCLALLAVSVVTALGMGIATRWSFQRGCIGSRNEIKVQRMEGLASALEPPAFHNRPCRGLRPRALQRPYPLPS